MNSIAHQKHTLLSKIRIFDNFIPDYDHDYLNSKYGFDNLDPNYYLKNKRLGQDGKYPEIRTMIADNADRAVKELGYESMTITTSVYFLSDIDSPFKELRHVDDTSRNPNGYTFSFHVHGHDNCGGTAFYEDFMSDTPLLCVPFKRNRLVLFPARIPHTGYSNPGYPNKSRRVIYTLFTVLH